MNGASAETPAADRPTGEPPRLLLRCRANPNPGVDYLVAIDDNDAAGGWTVKLRYVPDKLVLEPNALARYVARLVLREPDSPERLALTILEDFNNEAIPRWVEVACADSRAPQHRVLVEDRQPNWDNPALLARLPTW